jgi:pyridoxal phosphate enzyme (YggS family)
MEQYKLIKQELDAAGVALVAVSKFQPVSAIEALYQAGHRDFGENYIQELVEKQAVLPADIRWHVIGHVQRNKVKYIAPFVHLIHSVDSERLLIEIDKQAAMHRRVIDVLLQVHVAQEETKSGYSPDELIALVEQGSYANLVHVRIRGLMGMASFTNDKVLIGQEFAQIRTVYDHLKPFFGQDFETLSMGMSADFRQAVEWGSTMVRIGSLLFGKRPT